ncbi:MAG: RnfABCDGE type electron transport complex subunit D [Bacteroidales bacterium]|nr:RnfABCDGE type electron transport complex subunit D [Bacteroidales bacterium]
MAKNLVSPSPHIHTSRSTDILMTDVLIALLPAALVSIVFYGLNELLLLAVGLVSCVLFEWLIQKYLLKSGSPFCGSSAAVTGVLLTLNLPSAAPWWIVVIGAAVAIGVAKMTFGGLGQNIFNPALVGRVFLLVSFPVIMTDWTPTSPLFNIGADAFSGATPLALISEGLHAGQSASDIITANNFTAGQMLFARIGGSAGEISVIALLIGFVYLLARKVIRPHITLSIWATVALMTTIFWLCNPAQFTGPVFNLLTGGLMLGSIFMATDYVTSPMTLKGQVIFGVGIGAITVLIRYFGSYPEGVSFAILIMNVATPLLNKIQPKRVGQGAKK